MFARVGVSCFSIIQSHSRLMVHSKLKGPDKGFKMSDDTGMSLEPIKPWNNDLVSYLFILVLIKVTPQRILPSPLCLNQSEDNVQYEEATPEIPYEFSLSTNI